MVFTNFWNIIVLFSTMVEKCSRTLIFYLLFCFVTSFGMISLSKASLTSIIFKTIIKIYLKFWTTHNFINFMYRSIHMLHHISTLVPPTIQCICCGQQLTQKLEITLEASELEPITQQLTQNLE